MMPAANAASRPSPGPGGRGVLAFVADEETREAIARALQEAGLPEASIVDGGIDAALKRIEPGSVPRTLVVDVSESQTPIVDVAALAAIVDPGTRLIAIGTTNDVALFRDLLGVGATDYLVKPLDGQLLQSALLGGEAVLKPARGQVRVGRVVSFIGARSGIGTTTLAVNMAWLFAEEQRQRTALVDLDLHFGTAALSLDLEPGRGLREALERPSRIDNLFMDRALARATERLSVLGCEESLRDNPPVDPRALDILITELRQNFAWVVIDMPRSFLLGRWAALQSMGDIVLLCEQSLAGVRDTMRILEAVKENAPQARVRLVAAADPGMRPKVPKAEFEKNIGRKIEFEIPFDAKAVASATNAGKAVSAVARGSPVVKGLRTLAVDFAGKAEPKRLDFLRRWISF